MEELTLMTNKCKRIQHISLGTAYSAITDERVPRSVWAGHLAEEMIFELKDDWN